MSKPERNSRRLAKGEPSDTPFDELEDTTFPEVEATPKSEGTTTANTHASSSISTPSVKPTPTPAAPLKSSTKITKQDIESMIAAATAQTAQDITTTLEEKHRIEMQGQQDVMRTLEKAMKALTVSQLTKSKEKDTQASPFETPRATRP